jgi:hypothetical protein
MNAEICVAVLRLDYWGWSNPCYELAYEILAYQYGEKAAPLFINYFGYNKA